MAIFQNPNVVHYSKLLEAELAAIRQKPDEARTLFEEAVHLAEGRKEVSAIAKIEERFAQFELRQQRTRQASIHMQRAFNHYEEWGAQALCSNLRDQHPELMLPIATLDIPNEPGKEVKPED